MLAITILKDPYIAPRQPGDRLVLLPGVYAGAFVIGEPSCSDGSEKEPIQVVGRPGAVLGGDERTPPAPAVLSIRRAFWQFRDLEISPGESSRTNAVLTAERTAHDLLFDRCHIHEGFRTGMVIGAGSWRVTVSRCDVHGFSGRTKPDHSHGIDVTSGAKEVRIVGNELHGNGGASIGIEGPHGHGKEMSSLVEKITVDGNRIHDDGIQGLHVRGAQGVRVADNLFWRAGPGAPTHGSRDQRVAVEIWTNVENAVVEGNRFVGEEIGVIVGKAVAGAEGPQEGPFNVSVRRNAFEGLAAYPESVGILVGTGVNVRVANNVVVDFPIGLRVLAEPPHSKGIVVANNLVLGALGRVFEAPDLEGLEAFDHNYFGVAKGARLLASVDGKVLDLRGFLEAGNMPGSRVVEGLSIVDHDLARVGGADVVDAGRPVKGLSHKGKAPDIGVAEK